MGWGFVLFAVVSLVPGAGLAQSRHSVIIHEMHEWMGRERPGKKQGCGEGLSISHVKCSVLEVKSVGEGQKNQCVVPGWRGHLATLSKITFPRTQAPRLEKRLQAKPGVPSTRACVPGRGSWGSPASFWHIHANSLAWFYHTYLSLFICSQHGGSRRGMPILLYLHPLPLRCSSIQLDDS